MAKPMTQKQAQKEAKRRWGKYGVALRGMHRQGAYDATRCWVGWRQPAYVNGEELCRGGSNEGSGDTWEEAFAAADETQARREAEWAESRKREAEWRATRA